MELFTFSTEFSTENAARIFRCFRRSLRVFHCLPLPFSPVFPLILSLHNPLSFSLSPFFCEISSGQRRFCTASPGLCQKSKCRPFTFLRGAVEDPFFLFILSGLRPLRKRKSGRRAAFPRRFSVFRRRIHTGIHEKQDNCLVLIAPTARWILRRRTDAQSAAVPIKISYFNGRVVSYGMRGGICYSYPRVHIHF